MGGAVCGRRSRSAGALVAALVLALLAAAPAAAAVPECQGQSVFVREDKPADLYATCFVEGDVPLTYTISNGPHHGTITTEERNGLLALRYDPVDGYRGPDSFDLRASDGTDESDPVTISLTVTRNHAPQCWSTTAHTRVGQAATINVSTCFDQDYQDSAPGLEIALDPAAPPAHGTLSSLDASGLVTYTPTAGYTGADGFGVTVSDGDLTANATQRVHVAEGPFCSAAPEIRLRPGTFRGFSADCTQPGDSMDALEVVVVDEPEKGSLIAPPSGFFTYHADAGESGSDPFSFKAVAGARESAVVTQAVVIDPDANHAPTCEDPSAFTAYAGRATPLFPPCTDVDGDPLTYAAVGDPAHGTLSDAGGQLAYTPDAGYLGEDAASFTVSDGRTTVGPERLPIDVRPAEAPGCAPQDPLMLRPGASATVFLQCTNPQGDEQTYEIVSQPGKGQLVAGDFPGQFRYTAGAAASGADSFSLRAVNPAGESAPVTVDVTIDETVNGAPSCVTNGFLPLKVTRAATTPLPLAAQCTDPDGDPLLFTRVSGPEPGQGTVEDGPAAVLDYAAEDLYLGAASFQFIATDDRGLTSDPVAYELEVVENAEPQCTPNPTIAVRPGGYRNLTLVCQDPNQNPLSYEIVAGPGKGTLSPSGTQPSPFRSYTAGSGSSGADSFTYRVTAGGRQSAVYTQDFDVTPAANEPPTCFDNVLSPVTVVEGRPRTLNPPCMDPDGDALTYALVDAPDHGTMQGTTYTPVEGYTGPDSLGYTATDGRSPATATQTLHLQVVEATAPTCPAPLPITMRTGAPPRSIELWCRDSVTGEPSEVVVDDPPDHGELVAPDGAPAYVRTYEPDPGFEGEDEFSFHGVADGLASAPVTQEITVDPDHNTAPQCAPMALTLRPGGTKSLFVACFDADGDALDVEIASQPAHGTASGPSDAGLVTYAADATYLGSDPFSVRVADGHGGVVTQPVGVTVTEANSAPTCAPGAFTVASGETVVLPPPPCSDPEGDPLTFEVVAAPQHGDIGTNLAGQRTFTADLGYTGADEFTYRASDGDLQSAVTKVGVTITAPVETTPECTGAELSVAADDTLDVELECSDADGDALTLEIVDEPAAETGTLGEIDDGTVRFTPAAGYRGETGFTFRASDGGRHSQPATVAITVTQHGFAPQVWLGASTATPRTGAAVTFDASAFDPDGGALAGYAWKVDGSTAAPGADPSELVHAFTAAGQHTVSVAVTDDEGDTTTRSIAIAAHTENQAPSVSAFAEATTVGTGVPVELSAYAFDPDGSIAAYEWDFDDGSGAGERQVTHAFAAPGTYQVEVTATDDAGAPATAQLTITVTNANTPSTLDVDWWPSPAQRGQATQFWVGVDDDEGDVAAKYEWDLDGNGSYETNRGAQNTLAHTFTAAGTFDLGLKVTDGRGLASTRTVRVQVVNGPPLAKISGPPAIDTGGSGTYTDASTDDGSIASRAWDTDGDGAFDDGTGTSVTIQGGSEPGHRTLRLRVTDNEGESAVAMRTVTVRTPGPISISDPVLPPLPGGGTVHVGTTVDPLTGQTTITIPRGEAAQFPNQCVPVDIGVLIRKAAGATVTDAVLVVQGAGGEERFPMEDADGDGVWSAHMDCALAGTMSVTYTVRTPGEPDETFTIPAGAIVLIDPQGVVHDRAAFDAFRAANPAASDDAARAATAIEGATVRLQRRVGDEWRDVSASDPGIDPNVNPQRTGANGLYRWDVADGVYRVRVSAPGYRSKTSEARVIPPPALDLHVGLERNAAPVAGIDAGAQAGRNEAVTFTSDSTDDRAVVEEKWDLDADGQFDDATGPSAQRSFAQSGAKTVSLQVADADGEKSVAEHSVTVVNRPPDAVVASSAAQAFRGVEVTFTATPDDPDGDDTVDEFAWDLDADGDFDDGTAATAKRSFTTLGAPTVKVRVTDDEGAEAVASKSVQIVNRPPTATVAGTEPPAGPHRGLELTFTAAATDLDGTIAGYEWALDPDGLFDDGTGATAKRAFTTLGPQTVKVRVTDNDGGRVVAEKLVQVVNRGPAASFTYAPVQPVADQTVTFTSGSTDPDGTPLDLKWDLDNDGQFDDATGATASRAFPEGKHSVWLRADDGEGATQSVSALVIVAAKPVTTPPGGQPTDGGQQTGGQQTGGGAVTGGGGPAPDTKAPALKVTPAKGQRLRTLLAGGMKLLVEVDEPGALKLQLLVDKATARRLGIDKRAKQAVVIGTLSKTMVAGKATMAVKLTAKARKALKRARSAKLQIAAAIADAAGNQAKGTQTVTLRR